MSSALHWGWDVNSHQYRSEWYESGANFQADFHDYAVDLYKRHLNPAASPDTIVRIGRIATVVFVLVVCLIAPMLASPAFGGIFTYIQEFQGYVSPGILGVFLFGLLVRRAPPMAGVAGLLVGVPVYGKYGGRCASVNRLAVPAS